MTPRSYASGYSLLELLVALAVFALISAAVGLSAPILLGDHNVSGMEAGVRNAIEASRAQALRQSKSILLAVSADGKQLMQNGISVLAVDADPSRSRPIVFDAQGFSSGGAITLLHKSGGTSLVTVEPMTSRIRIQEQ